MLEASAHQHVLHGAQMYQNGPKSIIAATSAAVYLSYQTLLCTRLIAGTRDHILTICGLDRQH